MRSTTYSLWEANLVSNRLHGGKLTAQTTEKLTTKKGTAVSLRELSSVLSIGVSEVMRNARNVQDAFLDMGSIYFSTIAIPCFIFCVCNLLCTFILVTISVLINV